MKVLDLFSGLGGWSQEFKARGHSVFTVDNDPDLKPDLVFDILKLSVGHLPWMPDVILASPPCETFSVASIGAHWTGGAKAYVPKTEAARIGMQLVQKTLVLGRVLKPKFFILENPRGVLRKLGILPVKPQTVWYCHYGEQRAKPTDLWGMPFPKSFTARPPCHNRRQSHDALACCCADHDAAPRGAKTGTQGLPSYARRSLVPRELSLDMCLACERG